MLTGSHAVRQRICTFGRCHWNNELKYNVPIQTFQAMYRQALPRIPTVRL